MRITVTGTNDVAINLIQDILSLRDYNLIIVDGSECVGKTKFLRELSEHLDAPVYRPNYEVWESLKLPKTYRWVIGLGFLDYTSKVPILGRLCVDRGMMSGIIYSSYDINEEDRMMSQYLNVLDSSKLRVLHVLITPATIEDYYKMIYSRGISTEDLDMYLDIDEGFTRLYKRYSDEIDQIVFKKKTSDDIDISNLCDSCAHIDPSGLCRNPESSRYMLEVVGKKRCDHTMDKEVQDR